VVIIRGDSTIPVFVDLAGHGHGQSPLERHSLRLLKAIAALKYIEVRMLQIAGGYVLQMEE
jgi:hypothetical protein